MTTAISVLAIVVVLIVATLLGVFRVSVQRVRLQIGIVGFPISDNYRNAMGYDVWLYLLVVALVIGVRWSRPQTAGNGNAKSNGHTWE